MRRASTNSSPSSASSVTNTSVAPAAAQAASISSTSAVRDVPGASDWATSSAPASRSRPIGRKSSTALIDVRSISSSIEGRIVRRTATTARAAASTVGKVATIVERAACAGTSRRIARVTTPRVPSLPTNSFISDSPATSLIRLPPRWIRVPSASTTSRPST